MSATQLQQSEKQFQGAVIEYAQLLGWRVFHPFDSRRSDPGFPDLTLVRRGELILAELKAENGRLSTAQEEWRELLSEVEHASEGAIEVFVWRPSDWPLIEAVLR